MNEKKYLAILNTARSLIQTLCLGVVDGFTIKMKIVYSHFPITVNIEGKKVLIKNFSRRKSTKNFYDKRKHNGCCERKMML